MAIVGAQALLQLKRYARFDSGMGSTRLRENLLVGMQERYGGVDEDWS